MTQEMKFMLTLDGRQFSGTLQESAAQAKQFTDATTAGATRASEALNGMGAGATAAAAGGRRASESLRDLTGQANAAATASGKVADAVRRLTQTQKLDLARDVLNIRSFHDIQREIDQTSAAYNRLANSGKLSEQELDVANRAHLAGIQRLKQEMQGIAPAMEHASQAGQVSAGQTAAAWRQLPMQLQDVAVSLQGGMSPFTVLMQQGPQITSSFGGVKETLVALRGAITPLMVGIAGGAAAVAALVLAYSQGSDEAPAFNRALISTGGYAGVTAGQLQNMASGMASATVTQHAASAALVTMVGTGRIYGSQLASLTAAAVAWEHATGTAVAETAKSFSELGGSPVEASLKLNQSMHYLTESAYLQIKALEDHGRTTEAGRVAQEAYAASLKERAAAMEGQLGTLERAWRGISGAAAGAWDKMLGIGRAETLQDKLAKAGADLKRAQQDAAAGPRKGLFGETVDDGSGAQADLAAAQRHYDALQAEADSAAKIAASRAAEARQVEARAKWDKGRDSAANPAQKLAKATAQAQQDGAEANASPQEIAAQVATISFDFNLASFDGRAAVVLAKAKATQEAIDRQQDASQARIDAQRAQGLVSESAAAQASQAIERARLSAQASMLDQQIAMEKARPVKAGDPGAADQKVAKVTDLTAQRAAIADKLKQSPILLQYKIEGINLAQAREDASRWAQSWQQADDLVKSLAEQTAQGLASSMSDPLQRAQAQADLAAQSIVRNAAKSAREIGNEADILRGQASQAVQAQSDLLAQASAARSAARAAELRQLAAEQGQQAATASGMASALQERLDKINAGAKLAAEQATAKPATDGAASAEQRLQAMRDEMAAVELVRTKHIDLAQAVEQVANARLNDARADATARGQMDRVAAIEREIAARQKLGDLTALRDYLGADVGTQIAAGFDSASQSMAAFVRGFGALMKVQEDYGKAKALAGTDTQKLAAVEAKHAKDQVGAYATMLGAAKGFFREGSNDWKNLQKAEQAFRAVEMAMSIKSAALKMGLISEETAARLSGYADSAMAAVSAAGTEILALFGIGTAAAAVGVANQAQGDPYSAPARMVGMAAIMAGLGFIVGGIGGGSSEHAKTNTGTGTVLGAKDAQSASIKGSLDALAKVDLMTSQYSAQMAASLRNIETSIGGVSALLARTGRVQDVTAGLHTGYSGSGGIGAKLFGSKTTVVGQGITGDAQALGSILADGSLRASYYADIETKKKFFGITTSTRQVTQLKGADAELEHQFGSILSSFASTVRSAAAPLGLSLGDVERQISAFVVDIGKVDLQGLTGEQVAEKLSAVFGAVGDNLAHAALAGFDRFQQVGEGYLQTVARVASATESAGQTLARLGVRAVDLSYLLNTQGDIAAEIVRQSIVVAETGASASASSIGKFIDALGGTAQELADTYRTLVDVRSVLASVGISGQAVTADLIRGAGSLSALKDGAAAYEEKFLTAAEQTALKTSRMTAEFARLGVALPATAADFRHLVEGVSTATAAGQAQLGGLLALSSAFSDFITVADGGTAAAKSAADVASERTALEDRLLAAQGNTAALRARELAKLDASNRALQIRVWALEDEKKAADALAASGKGIAAFLDELRGAAGGDASVSARRATYQTDLASAQAGDTEASGRIVADARALIEAVKATASDPLTLARETSRIAAQLDALPAAMAYAAQQVAAASAAPAAATTAAAADLQGLPPATGAAPAVPVVIQQAAAPVPVIVPPAPFQPQEQDDSALLAELRALRAEVAALRQSSEDQGAAIATNTGRAARVLEAVTPDGDAITTRATR